MDTGLNEITLKQVSILEFYSNVISEVRSENKFIIGKKYIDVIKRYDSINIINIKSIKNLLIL